MNRLIAEISRFILAITLLFSGGVKAIDPIGGSYKIIEYFSIFNLQFLSPFAIPTSIFLNSFELVLGVLLLMGIAKKFTAWSNLLFMSIMTVITFYLFRFNPIHDCGCFGEVIKLTNGETFAKNIILCIFSLVYFFLHKKTIPTYPPNLTKFALSFALIGITIFSYANYAHLPFLDFRPYKIGASILELVYVPKDAPKDKYEYEFIYERNGEKRSFLVDSLPDASWKYIDRKEKLIVKGYRPPVTDFSVFDDDIEVTNSLLYTATPMIWITSPNWETVNHRIAPRLNSLYKIAKDKGILLYAMSGASKEERGRWKNSTNALYPLLFLDETSVKTIARGNPSVIFIKNGKIINKINAYDLKNEELSLRNQIGKIFAKEENKKNQFDRLIMLLIWLISTIIMFFISIGSKYIQINQNQFFKKNNIK